jgi:DNA-binding SARP family transcriptional activator
MLTAYLLGDYRLIFNEKRKISLPTKRARSLFAYLLINTGQWSFREILPNEIWAKCYGDPKKALRNELWVIRSALANAGLDPDSLIEYGTGTLRIPKSANIWVDALELSKILPTLPNPGGLTEVIDLYRGEFMPGHYDEWTHLPREIYRQKYLSLLECSMLHFQEQENWDQAIVIASHLVNSDPILEFGHRSLMLYYYKKGNRAAAIRQYSLCRDILRRELQIQPMKDTIGLYHSILAENNYSTSKYVLNSRRTALNTKSNTNIKEQLAETRDAIERLIQATD